MSIDTTRRGFLRGSIGTAVLGGSACKHDLTSERAAASRSPEAAPTGNVQVHTTVNGKARVLEVDPDASALEVVRTQLGLTGGKLGCGHGACGACTMQVDGTPLNTCLLPATALEGRNVVTVEGVAPSSKALHAVQRAFMAEDGLQCGYCTPGFIVGSAAFVDRWRAAQGDRAPDRGTVAAALAGHLCRCAAYDAIYEAVQGACAGRFDAEDPTPLRHDAREKVTGTARYTVDVQLPGQLVARALHSPYAHAKVTKLDWTRALAMPGVRGVVEMLGEGRRIRYAGQEVLALAAIDERSALRALARVEIAYEVLEPVLDLQLARREDAPAVFERPKDRRHPQNATEGPLLPEKWNGNLRGPLALFSKQATRARKAVAAARRDGTLVEGRFTTAVQCHTTLEPHAAVATWSGSDQLTVYVSTQAVTHMAEEIATHFGLKRDGVRVLAEYVGGGFGGKAGLTTEVIIAVELARVCQAPVGYALDRRMEIMIGGHRPATDTELAVAADEAGALTGVRAVTHSSSGVAVGHVTALMLRILYPDAPKDLVDYDVVTHGPPGKPFRGPGGPQAYWALEQGIDGLAHQRGEDPLQMRRRWDPNPARAPLYTWAETLPIWAERPRHHADKGRFRRGVGLAFAAWFAFAEPRSRVQIDAGPAGIVVSTGAQDMGNGTRSILARAVGDELGVPPAQVIVRVGDSNFVHGPFSAGSRTTSSLVPACVHACAQLKEELVELAERHFGLVRAGAGPGGVEHADGILPWTKVLEVIRPVRVIGRRKRDKGGYVLPPIAGLVIEKYISSSIQIVSLTVDTRLGRVQLEEAWAGFGVGRLITPELAVSQAKGGILQGLSYALYEERRLDPKDGFLLSAGLEDYRIMGIGDVPRIHVHFDERGYEKTRAQAVGLGELVTLAPAAAVGNAVFDATGWRPRDLPLRPDRVLQGVRG